MSRSLLSNISLYLIQFFFHKWAASANLPVPSCILRFSGLQLRMTSGLQWANPEAPAADKNIDKVSQTVFWFTLNQTTIVKFPNFTWKVVNGAQQHQTLGPLNRYFITLELTNTHTRITDKSTCHLHKASACYLQLTYNKTRPISAYWKPLISLDSHFVNQPTSWDDAALSIR